MVKINLKCSGDTGDVHLGHKPDTVTFTTNQATCLPLKSITPDPPAPCLSKKVINPDGSISYYYDGSQITTGYPFKYVTSLTVDAGNGTGVIKN